MGFLGNVKVIEQNPNGDCIFEETLSDGSKVYDVRVEAHEGPTGQEGLFINCVDLDQAVELFRVLTQVTNIAVVLP